LFPRCIMIFHPTVYWGDGAMLGFPHPDNARKTLTSRSTRKACGVIPYYAFFRKEDVLGAYFKRAGTRETRMHVLPDTPEFRTQIRSTKPISYLWHGEPDSHAWGGRRCTINIREGAGAVAVVDHKGGKTHNSPKQRMKVLYQAQRFGTQNGYIIIPKRAPEPMKIKSSVPVERVLPRLPGAEVYRILKALE